MIRNLGGTIMDFFEELGVVPEIEPNGDIVTSRPAQITLKDMVEAAEATATATAPTPAGATATATTR